MTAKRFELISDLQGQVDIIDHVESDEKNAICIYNDLGVLPFTSALSLCDLLNELNEENQYLKSLKWNQDCINEISIGIQQRQLLEKENEQLKQFKNEVFKLIDKRIDNCEPTDYIRTIKGDIPVFDCETATEIRVLNELKRELRE